MNLCIIMAVIGAIVAFIWSMCFFAKTDVKEGILTYPQCFGFSLVFSFIGSIVCWLIGFIISVLIVAASSTEIITPGPAIPIEIIQKDDYVYCDMETKEYVIQNAETHLQIRIPAEQIQITYSENVKTPYYQLYAEECINKVCNWLVGDISTGYYLVLPNEDCIKIIVD